MLTRRALAKLVVAAALSGGLPFGPATQAFAQGAAGPSRRGAYLIKNGAVVTVDAARTWLAGDAPGWPDRKAPRLPPS